VLGLELGAALGLAVASTKDAKSIITMKIMILPPQ
jgi:hypothetical protein